MRDCGTRKCALFTNTHTHNCVPEYNVAVCPNVLPTILYANGVGLWGHTKLLLAGFSESFQIPLRTFGMGVRIRWTGNNVCIVLKLAAWLTTKEGFLNQFH